MVTSPLGGNVDRTLQEAEEIPISDKNNQKVMIDEIWIAYTNLQKRKKGASSKSPVLFPKIISWLWKEKKELHSPLFKFEVTKEVAEFNWNLLSSKNFDIEKVLNPKKFEQHPLDPNLKKLKNEKVFFTFILDGLNQKKVQCVQ